MAHLIDDFGEKIGGAKKDLWKLRGMMKSDLSDINDKELDIVVKRDNIWVNTDWVSMKDSKEPVAIYFIKYVREKLPAKYVVNYRHNIEKERERAGRYIQTVREVEEFCLKEINSAEDLTTFLKKFCTQYEYIDVDSNKLNAKSSDNLVFSSGWVKAVQLNKREIEALKSECIIQGFPDSFRGDLKGCSVAMYCGKYRIIKNGKLFSSATFNTLEEAYKFATTDLIKLLDEKKLNATVTKKGVIKVVRPQLEHIERLAPNVRNGVNATSDTMLNVFKFRGGEFGNWNNDNDRQACLNYAFDAFCDLAYVLDIPLDKISL